LEILTTKDGLKTMNVYCKSTKHRKQTYFNLRMVLFFW